LPTSYRATPRQSAATPRVQATRLYVTSEESARQTKLRASRLGIESPNLFVLAETNVERILNQINKVQPAVVVIDSIQMIYKPDVPPRRDRSRSCAIAAWIWCIWPSERHRGDFRRPRDQAGTLAGPKIIEHIVDTVVYFEGDRFHSHRSCAA